MSVDILNLWTFCLDSKYYTGYCYQHIMASKHSMSMSRLLFTDKKGQYVDNIDP